MKLTCVTAVFNAIKSGNRENLIRCVRSVAALKTEHEHLIYDGASTDGTVELLRELEREINGEGSGKKVGGESRSTADVLSSSDAEGIPRLRVVSEPDTGIYNALNKGVRDAKGEWFYVLGCDDYIEHPEGVDQIMSDVPANINMVATPVKMVYDDQSAKMYFPKVSNLKFLFLWGVCNHRLLQVFSGGRLRSVRLTPMAGKGPALPLRLCFARSCLLCDSSVEECLGLLPRACHAEVPRRREQLKYTYCWVHVEVAVWCEAKR